MLDLITVESPEYDCPSPKKPGRILFQVLGQCPTCAYRNDYEVLDYDGDSAVFWMSEGVGFQYWLDTHLDLELDGFYVVEGITVTFTRGDGWMTDDDEEWEFGIVRRASPQEIESETLEDAHG